MGEEWEQEEGRERELWLERKMNKKIKKFSIILTNEYTKAIWPLDEIFTDFCNLMKDESDETFNRQ